jgi:hypothetical protein
MVKAVTRNRENTKMVDNAVKAFLPACVTGLKHGSPPAGRDLWIKLLLVHAKNMPM